jgi:predicted RNA-binding protein with PIN domain
VRSGRCHRGVGRGGGGGALSAPDELLRQAIELAWAVAHQGARLRPPIAPPTVLKPFLKMQKLPAAALGPIRKAVESDEDFRARVAAIATDDNVGAAGLLWLERPDGWEAELDRLAGEYGAAAEAAESERGERDARKRVDAAEQAARSAQVEAAAANAALSTERGKRDELVAALAKADRRTKQLEIELGGARRKLEQADEREAALRAELVEARAELARVQTSLDAAREVGTDAIAEVAALQAQLERRAGGEALPIVRGPSDMASVVAALSDAAAATVKLGEALAATASSLAAPEPPRDAPPTRHVRTARARRSPVPLPGGVFADTVEAAAHLLRVSGMVLLVDGYNVAKLGWPELTLADQRTRLLDTLEEVGARFPAPVHVVFDGADVVPPALHRRHLKVSFSPAGILADDVIVELAREVSPDRPIVVATNDAELRARCRAEGANLITSEQLLAVARRA